MSLLSKIGGTIKSSVRSGTVDAILNTYNNYKDGYQLSLDTNDNMRDISNAQAWNAYTDFVTGSVDGQSQNGDIKTYPHKKYTNNLFNDIDKWSTAQDESLRNVGEDVGHIKDKQQNSPFEEQRMIKKTPNYYISDVLDLKIPDWGYDNFINERAIFQKGLGSLFEGPGWFYFKVFFNFDTQHGLFGGILNNQYFYSATNSAAKYLYVASNLYRQERPLERITALFKFTSLLSFISSNAPWFFKSVKGLNNIYSGITKDFSKEKSIDIELNQEAIDMRLSTLMSLYKYACFDEINNKEIIPENLRKFDMSIFVFAAPINKIHTSMVDNESGTTYNYKRLVNQQQGGWSDVMSYKMYTFKNCEFDLSSMGNVMPASMSNEQPFNLGKSTLKIRYDRVYEHTMNEFYRMMWGSTGFYYNHFQSMQDATYNDKLENTYEETDITNKRLETLYKALTDTSNSSNDKTKSDKYKKVVEASEAWIHSKLMGVTHPLALGNFSKGREMVNEYEKDAEGNIKPKKYTPYWNAKLSHMKDRSRKFNDSLLDSIYDRGVEALLKLLKSSYSSNTLFQSGTNLYGDVGIGSVYWLEKLKKMKHGDHVFTSEMQSMLQLADKNRWGTEYYDPDTNSTRFKYSSDQLAGLEKLHTQIEKYRNINGPYLSVGSQYFADKMKLLKRGSSSLKVPPQSYKYAGVGSEYWDEKLKWMKHGDGNLDGFMNGAIEAFRLKANQI